MGNSGDKTMVKQCTYTADQLDLEIAFRKKSEANQARIKTDKETIEQLRAQVEEAKEIMNNGLALTWAASCDMQSASEWEKIAAEFVLRETK